MRDLKTTLIGFGGSVVLFVISSLFPEAETLKNIALSSLFGFLGFFSKDSKK